MNLNYGWCKGLKLKAPKGETTRPTSARVREALMSMLMPYIQDGVFVDLFAGSGAVGLDALSRGAEGVVFVEKDRAAIKSLQANIAEAERRADKQDLQVGEITLYSLDVNSSYKRVSNKSGSVSVIWADPPYEMTVSWLESSLNQLSDMLSEGGILALEAASKDRDQLNITDSSWELYKEKKYGDTILVMWKKK